METTATCASNVFFRLGKSEPQNEALFLLSGLNCQDFCRIELLVGSRFKSQSLELIWLVVEPTHLKHTSEIGFIFPNFRGEN